MSRQTIHLYTSCWDEADMLGFFFRHYDRWVDRYVVYDDGSTDGSLDILRAHPKVDLRRFERTDRDSFCLSHDTLRNSAWKESRRTADWVIVTAIDEHLHAHRRDLATYLEMQTAAGVTIVPALGFDMNHPELPPDRGRLVELVARGRPRAAFNTLGIFNPNAVDETGYAAELNAAAPTGDIRLPSRDTLMLWHYKHLGFERNAEREAAQAARLGETDEARSLAVHYLRSSDERRAFWSTMEAESRDLSTPDFVPDRACARPLWWDDAAFARVAETVVSPAVHNREREPRVSVLVKSYNHAPFVRQTIESVLGQGFEDFEIVATDDASDDGTAEVLRSIRDPRIRLEVLPRNLGISGAMNATIARARGRYLAILNSDDYAQPDRLQHQVDFLDAHPDVALMFGQIRAVDEADAPTLPYNDFSAPLRLPDFSRKSWLRYFFLTGNCLCAPTAMIRRHAYDTVGPYDPRLFNLQDFDMWVRMVAAGFDIHVSSDVLTTFRIRSNQKNASAPSMETRLRGSFEYLQILGRFAALPEATIFEVFSDLEDRPCGSARQFLGRLALRVDSPQHQLFGMQMLYESAGNATDHAELRGLMGTRDLFGIRNHARLTGVLSSFMDARRRALDDLAAVGEGFATALEAMHASPGEANGGTPVWFDDDAYLRLNPDVAQDQRSGGFPSGYAHWLAHGFREGRPFRTK